MNYLRATITAGYQYYRDLPPINASTLTGAIDVIVIQRQGDNGEDELACTPFHVRFGKWQILRPGEKKVNVLVNGRAIPFNMKIGEAGEAFFVFETDEDVPADLMTSPILEATNTVESGPAQNGGKFGSKSTSSSVDESKPLNQEDSGPKMPVINIQEPDFLDLDATVTPPKEPDEEPPLLKLTPKEDSGPSSIPMPEPTAPLDSAVAPQTFLKTTFDQARELGEAVALAAQEIQEEKLEQMKDQLRAAQNIAAHRVGLKKDDFDYSEQDVGDEALPDRQGGTPPVVTYKHDVVIDMAGYHSKETSDRTVMADDEGFRSEPDITSAKAHASYKPSSSDPSESGPERSNSDDLTPTSSRAVSPEPTTPETSIHIPRTSRSDQPRATSEPPDLGPSPSTSPPRYSWEWGEFPVASPSRTSFSNKRDEFERASSVPLLGDQISGGIEEDENEYAYIHFGKGACIKPAGTNAYVLEIQGQTIPFELSLCGDLDHLDSEEANLAFASKRVSYRSFMDDPSIVHNDDLTIQWRGKYISRKQSSPVLAALVVWRQSTIGSSIVQSDEEPLSSSDEREERPQSTKEPTTSKTGWSRWFSRTRAEQGGLRPVDGPNTRPNLGPHASAPDVTDVGPSRREVSPDRKSVTTEPVGPAIPVAPAPAVPTPAALVTQAAPPPAAPASGPERHYVKTLRLTSDQLKQLKLKKGPNSITFSLSTTGAVTCTARIFVWDESDQIVVSDIDGTITKSDALGHVFTMIGRDWTHMGVAKLYTDICRNGYKIMYLTSRAIGQADSTRDYLKGINQNNYQLPEGPVIMSPDRLIASLHREVIMRQPEVFKMACLRDIQRLFGPSIRNPFYAGFGNRITDALSYRSVNVPSGRIFTIDSSGEVKMELLELAGYKSSYIYMTDLVDQMFPPIHRKWAPEFTDANYWKQPIGDFEFPEFAPPSPTLSAMSDTSNQSRLSRLRNFSLRPAAATTFVPPSTSGHNHNRSSAMAIPTHSRHTSASSTVLTRRLIEDWGEEEEGRKARNRLSGGSMPGSYEDEFKFDGHGNEEEEGEEGDYGDEEDDYEDEEEEDPHELEIEHEEFDNELLEMDKVPFL